MSAAVALTAAAVLATCSGAGAGGCSGRAATHDPPATRRDGDKDQDKDKDKDKDKEVAMASSLHWSSVELSEIGVHADVVAGVALRRAPADGGGVVTQYGPDVWLAFARGPDATLAAFARGLEVGRARVQLGAEQPAMLCGRAATRLIAQRTDEGGEASRDGRLQQVPPTTRTHVAVAAQLDGAWTRAIWIVDAAARDRLAADEQHFFAAITCR